MTDLAKEELSTKNIVKVENKNWNWSNDTRKEPRFAILTVDKAQAEGTVITQSGIYHLQHEHPKSTTILLYLLQSPSSVDYDIQSPSSHTRIQHR